MLQLPTAPVRAVATTLAPAPAAAGTATVSAMSDPHDGRAG